jgi:hypothetical protein
LDINGVVVELSCVGIKEDELCMCIVIKNVYRDKVGHATKLLPPTKSECDVGVPT